MSDLPKKRPPDEPVPVTDERSAAPLPWFPPLPGFFLTATRTEVALREGHAQVRAERVHIENGRVVRERLEGQVPPVLYDDIMRAATEQMLGLMELMQQQMRLFLPWMPGPRR